MFLAPFSWGGGGEFKDMFFVKTANKKISLTALHVVPPAGRFIGSTCKLNVEKNMTPIKEIRQTR